MDGEGGRPGFHRRMGMNQRVVFSARVSLLVGLMAGGARAASVQVWVDAGTGAGGGGERGVILAANGACIEDVNHEIYGGLYSQMLFGESFQEGARNGQGEAGVSGMWSLAGNGRGSGAGAVIEYERPFVGMQSQRLTAAQGEKIELVNRGLNRWGLALVEGRTYSGCLWLRAATAMDVGVRLASAEGERTYAQSAVKVTGDDVWRRYEFTLVPSASDANGRFGIELSAPGSVVIGYASLEPGDWGRFKGLPVRKDVADAMIQEGITTVRYGGSMVNEPEYRWKRMVGPRDRRLPYAGHWYRHSSNGWGIVEFLDFCAAAGMDGTPDFCLDESPKDMADFADYVLGGDSTEWGRRRIAEGRREPYPLKRIEIGNEERVDDRYVARFEPMAEVLWAKYPKLVLVVGDFNYNDPITDPMHVTGADSKITSLEGQRKILAIAKRHDAEVWFDVHINTENPAQAKQFLKALKTYIDAIDSIAQGGKHRVVVFELNSNRHDLNRALASAIAMGTLQRDGRLPIVASANGLQPDGQNDNGWDQGLIFLNPSKVWLQPPAYAAQMIARSHQPVTLDARVDGAGAADLDVTACRSADGKTLVLRVVNPTDEPVTAAIHLDHFSPVKAAAARWELSGARDAANSASDPARCSPQETEWTHAPGPAASNVELPARSFTVLTIE